jgi:hypothetical protein
MHCLGQVSLLLDGSIPIVLFIHVSEALGKSMFAQVVLGAVTSERMVFGGGIGVASGCRRWVIVAIKLLALDDLWCSQLMHTLIEFQVAFSRVGRC